MVQCAPVDDMHYSSSSCLSLAKVSSALLSTLSPSAIRSAAAALSPKGDLRDSPTAHWVQQQVPAPEGILQRLPIQRSQSPFLGHLRAWLTCFSPRLLRPFMLNDPVGSTCAAGCLLDSVGSGCCKLSFACHAPQSHSDWSFLFCKLCLCTIVVAQILVK